MGSSELEPCWCAIVSCTSTFEALLPVFLLLGSFSYYLLHIGQMKEDLAYLHVLLLSLDIHRLNVSSVFLER